jgi:hypothetical protein
MRKSLLTKFNAIVVVFIFSGLSISLSYNQIMGSSQQFPTQQFPFPPLPELSATQKECFNKPNLHIETLINRSKRYTAAN